MAWFVEWWQFMLSGFWVWAGSLCLLAVIVSPFYALLAPRIKQLIIKKDGGNENASKDKLEKDGKVEESPNKTGPNNQ